MSLKSCEKTGTNEVTLELSISAEAFADANNKAYNKVKKNIAVPGFRKGKAPKAFIEKYYGEGVFYDDALEIAFPEAYEAAVAEAGIDPVDNPFDFDIKSVGKDGVELSCKVTVKPEIELGEYKGLKAEKEAVAVTAEEIEAELNKKLEDCARIVDVDDRAVADGDIVTIDYEGFNDGVAFDGGKAEEFDLTIGSGQFIPGFEDQVVGMNIGETKDVNVTFPENYQAEALKGKAAVFAVKLNALQAKELPELTDEFIKDATGSATVEEYKAKAMERLQKQADRRANDATENSILEAIAANTEVEIPQAMLEREIDGLVQKFEYQLMYQGLKLADYLEFLKISVADFRKNYEEQAKKNVTSQLIISQIIKEEKLEATEEEINAKIAEQAASVEKEMEEYKKNMDPRQFDYIASDIVITKLFNFLKANNEMVKEA